MFCNLRHEGEHPDLEGSKHLWNVGKLLPGYRRKNLEGSPFRTHCRENLKSRVLVSDKIQWQHFTTAVTKALVSHDKIIYNNSSLKRTSEQKRRTKNSDCQRARHKSMNVHAAWKWHSTFLLPSLASVSLRCLLIHSSVDTRDFLPQRRNKKISSDNLRASSCVFLSCG
jgi:hypothetical protein